MNSPAQRMFFLDEIENLLRKAKAMGIPVDAIDENTTLRQLALMVEVKQ